MKRRSLLKYSGLGATAVIGVPLLPVFIQSCKEKPSKEDYNLLSFSKNNFAVFQSFADILIPETDTPGALSLGCAEWIDTVADRCFDEKQRKEFDEYSNQLINYLVEGSFLELSKDQKLNTLQNLESSDDPISRAYHYCKGLVGSAYLGTEYVGMNELAYLDVPGEYEACTSIDITKGKAWTYG